MAHISRVVDKRDIEKKGEKTETIGLLSMIFITLGLIQIVLIAIGLVLPVGLETFRPIYTTKVYFYLGLGTVVSFIIAFLLFRWLKARK